MAKVTNLKIDLQNGTTDTLYASWDFTEETKTVKSTVKVGDKVSIKAKSTYYNGADIPDWVEAKKWIVREVSGKRVVIDKSVDGKHSICSAIDIKYLNVSSKTVAKKTLDHYKVSWYYATGNGEWFSGGSSDVTLKNATYTIPSNATKVKVTVKPVSKTYTENNKTKSHWSGTNVSKEFVVNNSTPEKPSAPTVSIDKYTLTATLDNIEDGRADEVEFYIIDGTKKYKTGVATVARKRATFATTVKAGGKYRVCCRVINVVGKSKVYSEWSLYSSEVTTIPSKITKLQCFADTKTSVKLTWTGDPTATSYEIQYTDKKSYFDSSSGVNSTTVTNTVGYVTGLEQNKEWFFRVRSVNSQGESGWSSIVSKVIGTKPAAPTAWSSTVTAVIGEEIKFYWVHNSEDGSKQTAAELELTKKIDGKSTTQKIDVSGSNNSNDDEDEYGKIYSYTLSTSGYDKDTELSWRIRTKGIISDYSDWSTLRVVDIYAPPSLELHLGRYLDNKWVWDTFNFETDSIYTAYAAEYLECLPYKIVATAGPNTQTPVSYHIAITAEETYETENELGETIVVNAGSAVYSKVFNVSDNPLEVDISAGDIILENNQTYKVTVVVSMDSGLTATANGMFTVSWGDDIYVPDASIAIDPDALCAYITPFCLDDEENLIDDVVMSVYRREYDGKFTEIAVDIPNDGITTVTDPHPALDSARYRIVARNVNTTVVGYEDLAGIPINEPSIVIQWDEKWSQYNYSEEDEPESPPWNGSMVRLPYNVDLTESNSPDVSLIEYIGREHPVSYYGTQRGEAINLSTEVIKTDKETIYALRRLRAYRGDVYIREPSGIGYWANVIVSISNNHKELTIPVTIDGKRVEGGM